MERTREQGPCFYALIAALLRRLPCVYRPAMTQSSVLLEVCCDNIESVARACGAGAGRIELCSALEAGGITPSTGLIELATKTATDAAGVPVPVFVLVRPRGGDFCFSAAEHRVMLRDINAAAGAGAKGVVVGTLTPDGELDTAAMKELVDAAHGLGLEVTLHRAVDMCRDPVAAVAASTALGVDRVLSSGGAACAAEGTETLRRMVERAQSGVRPVVVMAGGGLCAANAAAIVGASGVTEVHGSLRSEEPCRTRYHREGVSMGSASSEFTVLVCDAAKVGAVVRNLKERR